MPSGRDAVAPESLQGEVVSGRARDDLILVLVTRQLEQGVEAAGDARDCIPGAWRRIVATSWSRRSR